MDSREFSALRDQVEGHDADVAGDLGVSVPTMRGWLSGRTRVPRRAAKLMKWWAAGEARRRALAASGLPDCDWMREWDGLELPSDAADGIAHLKRAEQHEHSCAICRSRAAFLSERFAPMPPYPAEGWMGVFTLIERIPRPLRPAAVGALALAAVVILRAVWTIPAVLARPALLGPLLLSVVVAACAGAAGGAAYSISRPKLEPLGRAGDYLTGIVCIAAYMAAIAAAAPILFGIRMIKEPSDWAIMGAIAVFFGPVLGHFWFGALRGSGNASAS